MTSPEPTSTVRGCCGNPRPPHPPIGASDRVLRRRLDAAIVGLLGVFFCMLEPRLRLTPLGDISLFYAVPALWTGIAVWRFCNAREAGSGNDITLWRLRLAVVIAAGLCPFVSWWSRSEGSLYLAVAAGVALPASGWFLFELTAAVRRLARDREANSLLRRARLDEGLVLFCLLAPLTAIFFTGLLTFVFSPGTALADIKDVWALLPLALKVVMTLAAVEVLALLCQVSMVLDADSIKIVTEPGRVAKQELESADV